MKPDEPTAAPDPATRRDRPRGDGSALARPRGACWRRTLRTFSRRTLLKGAAATTVVTAGVTARGGRSAAVCRPPTNDPCGEQVDVVVVGAGLAGLTAARVLTNEGRSVVVLEARDRVGGRMVRQKVGPGVYVDLGGQWAGPTERDPRYPEQKLQDRILALAKELGVKLVPWYHEGATRFVYQNIDATYHGTFLPFDGDLPPVPAEDGKDAVQDADDAWRSIEALAATVPPEAPWETPDAELLDQVTLAEWLDTHTHTSFARFAITNMARIGGSGAFEPNQVSRLHMAFTQKVSPQQDDPEHQLFDGGAGQIPLVLAAQLRGSMVPIDLNAPVEGIEQTDTGVTLRTDGACYRARYVIVAIPPILTGEIVYDPPLPDQRLELVQQMPMGSLLKVHAIYPKPFWREKGLSGIAITDLRTTPFTADSSPPSGEPGILTTFIAGKHFRSKVSLRDVSDQQHVEEAVVGLCLRAHHHPPAEVAAVRDDDVDGLPASNLGVDRDSHLSRLPARKDGERRPVVGDLPAERLRRRVRALCDRTADPRARHVREVGAVLGSCPGSKRHLPEVDLAHRTVQRNVDRCIEIARDPERPYEIPARAAGDDGELDVLGLCDAVYDLVHGAVAADDDEARGTHADGLLREPREVPRLL